MGIGAVATMAVLAVRPLTRRVGPILMAAVAVFGLGTIVLGVTRSYAVALIALLVLSGADSVSVFVRSTLVPMATPEDMRGRVMAVEYTFVGASNELGAFESGVAGALLGVAGGGRGRRRRHAGGGGGVVGAVSRTPGHPPLRRGAARHLRRLQARAGAW